MCSSGRKVNDVIRNERIMYRRGSLRGKISISNKARLVILTVGPWQDCVRETAEMWNSRIGKVILQVIVCKECRDKHEAP